MSDAPPKLEVVEGGGREAAAKAGPQPPTKRHRTWPAWLLLVLLWVALIGLGLETRRAGELAGQVEGLEGRVVSLEGQLGQARAAVSAHRDHLAGVRASVDALAELVGRDPEAPAAP